MSVSLTPASASCTPIATNGINIFALWSIRNSPSDSSVLDSNLLNASLFCIDIYKATDLIDSADEKITDLKAAPLYKRIYLNLPKSLGYPLIDISRSGSWAPKGLFLDDQFVFPFACTIYAWGFTSRQIGNVTVSVWRRCTSSKKWFQVGSNKLRLSFGEQMIPISNYSEYITVQAGDVIGIEQHAPNTLAVSNRKRGYLRAPLADQNLDSNTCMVYMCAY